MKYRKKVFTDDAIVCFLKIREIIETSKVDIIEIECDKYYFYMFSNITFSSTYLNSSTQSKP